MHVFYKPGIHMEFIYLDSSESNHCIKVLRKKKGDEVVVINGKGLYYTAVITVPDVKGVILKIISVTEDYNKRSYYLHIAIAPPKNIERFEWFLEKSVEIGIDEITPVICDRSERVKLRYERLEKVLISAAKQSIEPKMPLLNPIVRFKELIENKNAGTNFIAYCSQEPNSHLMLSIKNSDNITVLIGPEGDFSPCEINSAKENGFLPVNLGKTRLRTETAGIVAALITANSQVIRLLQKEFF